MLESAIEQHLSRRVKKLGGLSLKLSPTLNGVPDRLVLLPGGRLYFVELKQRNGVVAPIQTVMHERLRAIGFYVVVLRSTVAIDTWLASVLELPVDDLIQRGERE